MQRPHTRYGAIYTQRFKLVVTGGLAAPVSRQRHADQNGLPRTGLPLRVRMAAALATNPNHLFVEGMQRARRCA